MYKRRINIQGIQDYTGVNLKNIIADLKGWYSITRDAIHRLENLKKKVEANFERLEDTDSIIEYIDYCVSLFQGFEADFKRILDEIVYRVEERHIEIINQIFESSRNEEKYHNREFKREYIAKKLKDESLRPLLDEIYRLCGNLLLHNINLSNLNRRLQTFIGSKGKRKRLSIEDSEAIQIKPNIFGLGINFNYIIKRLFGKLINKK